MRAAAFALLLASAVCAAQGVPKPEVKVGDWWLYRSMDYLKNEERERYELRVSFVDGKVIHVVGRTAKEYDSIWTSEWNTLVSGGGSVYSPHAGLFKFPLWVGDIYHHAYEVEQARRGPAARIKHERRARVVGWEEVVVPAGKFRALKIQADNVFQRLDNPRKGTSRNLVWYVPAVKRAVKNVYEETNDLGRTEKTGEELVAFGPQ